MRELPQDIRAEKSVLGAIIQDNSIYPDIAEMIGEEDFYRPIHREVWGEFKRLYAAKEPIDTVTVKADAGVLMELIDSTPTSANAKHYAKQVVDASKARQAITMVTEIAQKAYGMEDTDTLATDLQEAANKLGRKTDAKLITIDEVFYSYMDELERRYKAKGSIPGLQTGYPDLDYKLGGLQNGNLYYIAARPSMGKTAFATNMAEFIGIMKRLPSAFFSLEMPKEQLMNRMVSSIGMIDQNKLRLGRLEDDDWESVTQCMGVISGAPLIIDDTPGLKMNDILIRAKRIRSKLGGLAVIFIDYLQFISGDGKAGNREQEVAQISRSLKNMAKELNCPVVCQAQLSRACEARTDKRPMLSDLRESGSIEQDADVVMFLYRDEYYEPTTEKKGVAEVIIAKGRNEGTGTIELVWLPQYTKFVSLKR